MVSLAICYPGGKANEHHARGINCLAEAINGSSHTRVRVDDNVPLAAGLDTYTLVCLVGQAAFRLSADEMNALYTFINGGGTVFMESCRRATTGGDSPAEAALLDLLGSLGIRLDPVQPGHRLLTKPFLFATPPAGFESQGTPKLLASDGVILSTFDYGCLWQGERRSGAASREEIRSALEWGHNLITCAVERRQQTKKE